MSKPDNTVFKYDTNELVCTVCGARQTGPKLPMEVSKFCREIRKFADAHASCQPAVDPVPTETP
jgi:hypothetical protein